jgi:hypothetical protein
MIVFTARMGLELGLLPTFFSDADPRSAAEQLNVNYAHGGGWNPLPGWKMVSSKYKIIQYPGDPTLSPVAYAKLRDEELWLYDHDILCIIQKDGSFECGRVD